MIGIARQFEREISYEPQMGGRVPLLCSYGLKGGTSIPSCLQRAGAVAFGGMWGVGLA